MMDLNHYVDLYKAQLQKGDIPKAYIGLVKYMTRLGTTLSNNLGDSYSFGSLFQGYMDYTYFYYSNDFLKARKLKLGLVLNHVEMRFEVWLLGQTIPIQDAYWQYFKTTKWNKNRTTKPQYSILEAVLIADPDFSDLDLLSRRIEDQLVLVSKEVQRDIVASKI